MIRTGRCCHGHGIGSGDELLAEGLNYFPEQDRLPCSSTSGVEQTLSFLSEFQDVILLFTEGDGT